MNMVLPAGSYVVAVSGGVDSVVLLHMLTVQKNLRLIVAHFDHGIREDSAADAKFVQELAARYGLVFHSAREELGAGASEEVARQRRYMFLRQVAQNYSAKIVTAHHANDVVETIAINLTRGTGWRGIAVLDSSDIVRPMLHMSKPEVISYANDHNLDWHEDSTNLSDAYLRNRLRHKLSQAMNDEDHRLLNSLRNQQVLYKKLIDEESFRLVGQSPYSRYFFTSVPHFVALELLRTVCLQQVGISPTRQQRERILVHIKTARAGTLHDIGGGVRIRFTRTEFVVEASEK